MNEKLNNKLITGEPLTKEDLLELSESSEEEKDSFYKKYLKKVTANRDETLLEVFRNEYSYMISEYPATAEKFSPVKNVLCSTEAFSKSYHNKYDQTLNELAVVVIQDEEAEKTVRDEVMDVLYEKNIGLIGNMLHRYSNKNDGKMTMEDLGQEAKISFIRAVRKFDPTMNNKFSTFAMTVIHNCIVGQYTSKINKMRESEISIETPVVDDGGSVKSLIDYQSDSRLNPEENVQRQAENEIIYTALNTLNMEQKFVAYCRFGLGGVEKKTQAEIAEYMHMSQANVSKIEKTMLALVKKELARKGMF